MVRLVLLYSHPALSRADGLALSLIGPPGQVAVIAGKKDGMKQGTLAGTLKELGYTEDQVRPMFVSDLP